jgi:Flp pilus assembly protein TadG
MRGDRRQNDKGQILIIFALALPLLVLFTAAAVDMGLIYVTKAKLSKAVDAACLTGVKNLSQGQTIANTLATDMFNANFGANPPTPAFTWQLGTATQPTSLQVKATATVNTYFMKYLPKFATWSLSDTATATRSNLVMSLILDRSGSMNSNGGGTALKVAVPNFVADFINGTDHIAMVSFATYSSVDVALTNQFLTPIKSAVNNLNFTGGTFGTGGTYVATNGPPLTLADNQNNSVSYVQETKVVVYFTDGLMNTIQDSLPCTNLGSTLYNFGGYDAATGPYYDFFTPSNGNDLEDLSSSSKLNGCTQDPYGGLHGVDCNGFPPYSSTQDCNGVTTFTSQNGGKPTAFTRANITAEAQYRAIATANAMRAETPVATYVYVIGLGNDVSGSPSTEAFLATLANDPNGPALYPGAVYNPNLPAGLFLVVTCNGTTGCSSGLNTAFQTIAAKILLRLTQ